MIERTLKEKIKEKLNKNKAILIYGPRQCGKTTLVQNLIKEEKIDCIALTGDDDNDCKLFETVSLNNWKAILWNKKFLFVDEGQKIKNLARAIKLLIDGNLNVNIIVTDSFSFTLANRLEESLTGRKYEFKLLPLSYKELKNHFGFVDEKKNLELRLIYGSYPEVISTNESKAEILQLISDSYLSKDLFQYKGIRKPQILIRLLKALSLQCGNEVSINELSSLLSCSRTIIESYIDLLEQAFIIFKLSSYSSNLRKELKKAIKIYFYDNGIRNSIIKDFRPLSLRDDTGLLFENYMIAERIKNYHTKRVYKIAIFGEQKIRWRLTI